VAGNEFLVAANEFVSTTNELTSTTNESDFTTEEFASTSNHLRPVLTAHCSRASSEEGNERSVRP